MKRLPGDRFLNRTAISHFWAMDLDIQHRYQQLGTSLKLLSRKTHRLIRRLFNLSKRCHRQPRFKLPKERYVPRHPPPTPGTLLRALRGLRPTAPWLGLEELPPCWRDAQG